MGVAAFGAEQAAVGAGAVGLDVLAEQGDELRGDRDFAGGPAGLGVGPAFGAAFEAAVLVDGAVVGVGLPGGGAGVGEGQVAPALVGEVAAGFGEGGDFGGAHQGVEHAAVEGFEARPLPSADGAACGEHFCDEFGAADGSGVEGVVGSGGAGPAFGQVGFAERVDGQPFFANGVAEAFVQTLLALSEGSRLTTPRSRFRPRDQLRIEWVAPRSGPALDVASGAYCGWVITGLPGQVPSGRRPGRAARFCSVVRGGGRCSSGLPTGRGR